MTLGQAVKASAKRALAPLARLATRRSARVLMYHRFGAVNCARRLGAEELMHDFTAMTTLSFPRAASR